MSVCVMLIGDKHDEIHLQTGDITISGLFCVCAFCLELSLPAHFRSIDTLSTFKRHLKFHLFLSAFAV